MAAQDVRRNFQGARCQEDGIGQNVLHYPGKGQMFLEYVTETECARSNLNLFVISDRHRNYTGSMFLGAIHNACRRLGFKPFMNMAVFRPGWDEDLQMVCQ